MMNIEVVYTGEKPDYMPLARHLLERIGEWFRDPEHEEEYQRWKAEREKPAKG